MILLEVVVKIESTFYEKFNFYHLKIFDYSNNIDERNEN